MDHPRARARAASRASVSVLHVITSLDVGGAERMLQKLVTSGNGAMHHRVVSLRSGGPIATELRAAGIDVAELGMTRRGVAAGAVASLIRDLVRQPPDVVQTWLYHADLVGAALGAMWRRPVAWNIRCAEHAGMSRPVVRACARLSARPVVVVANSLAGRAAHERVGYRPRTWEVIPNGFDTSRFRPDERARAAIRAQLGVPPDALLVGMVARHDPLKDHATFLAAMRRVRERVPGVHVILVGDGMDASNPAIAGALGDDDRASTYLLGRRDDVATLTAALDVACLTSVSEGFPNVIGEAMACGVVPVVTDAGDSRAIVGEAGAVVAPGDASAFADAVAGLLLDPSRRARLGHAARERVHAYFGLDAIRDRYAAMYRRLAGVD